MKKRFQKSIIFLAILAIFASALPVSADASTSVSKISAYAQPHANCRFILGSYSPTQSDYKISMTKNLGVVKSPLKDSYGYKFYYFYPRKSGKTTVTIKSKAIGKFGYTGTDKTVFTIYKYTNPISSIKLGNTRISASKFNKTDTITLSYSKFSKQKSKITVVPKKGWTFDGAIPIDKKGNTTKDAYGDTSSFKAKGGKGNSILQLRFTNKKNGLRLYTEIVFK